MSDLIEERFDFNFQIKIAATGPYPGNRESV